MIETLFAGFNRLCHTARSLSTALISVQKKELSRDHTRDVGLTGPSTSLETCFGSKTSDKPLLCAVMMRTKKTLCLLLGLLLLAHSSCCSAAKDTKASADSAGADAAEQSAVLQLNTDNIGDLIERQTAPALVRGAQAVSRSAALCS